MAEENESKDGKGQGGCCGCCIGCAVVIALLIAFLLGFYIVPVMRDNGWSFDVFSQKIREFRTRLGDKIDDWNYRFIKVKDVAEEEVREIEEKTVSVVKKVKEKTGKAVRKSRNAVEPLVSDDLEPNLIED